MKLCFFSSPRSFLCWLRLWAWRQFSSQGASLLRLVLAPAFTPSETGFGRGSVGARAGRQVSRLVPRCLPQQSCEREVLPSNAARVPGVGWSGRAKQYFQLFETYVLVIFKTKLLSLGREIAEIHISEVNVTQDFKTI